MRVCVLGVEDVGRRGARNKDLTFGKKENLTRNRWSERIVKGR